MPAAEAHAAPDSRSGSGLRRPRVRAARGREGEHRTTLAVEVPRERVHDIDEPRRDGAELLGARADASVHGRPLRGGEIPRHPPDRGRFDAAHGRDVLRGEVLRQARDLVDAFDVTLRVAEAHQAFGDDRVHQREEEVGVGARSDEEVLVGFLRGLGAARIHHDQATATGADCPQPAGDVRHRHEAAVRRERVRAQDEEVVRAVEVRDRNAQRAPEHESCAHLLRHLIHRARAEHVRGTQRLQEHLPLDHRAEVVRVGVAEVHADRVAVRLDDRAEAALDLGERLVPAHLAPRVTGAHLRPAESVRVRFELFDRSALRAQVAPAEHILAVPAHERDLVVLEMELQPAGCFTQRARTVRDSLRHGARVGP